ncbi:MAG: GNAT family N-acetyltransferase [Planctomycetes bacterium]|nr:GNAT family N-acetyltransferase [Planctomycetota bacterium]
MIRAVRLATATDAAGVVELFRADGNAYGWSVEKWRHYHVDYPDGEPVSVVAVGDDGQIIGHYAMAPIEISGHRAMLGLHAYVHPNYRGLEVISRIIAKAYEVCQQREIEVLCGFANRSFTTILSRIFGWNVVGYLQFVDISRIDLTAYARRLRFVYSEAWYRWKFGTLKCVYLDDYEKDGVVRHQLLKSRELSVVTASELGVNAINVWDPACYTTKEPVGWHQAFSVCRVASELDPRFLDINNWYIEMGDSDAFEPYRPWQTAEVGTSP